MLATSRMAAMMVMRVEVCEKFLNDEGNAGIATDIVECGILLLVSDWFSMSFQSPLMLYTQLVKAIRSK